MKTEYPRSLNNWFKDFPRTFKMTCGPMITEFGGPWGDGTKIILSQTPLSKVTEGVYQVGVHLPDYKIIYSNTGSDTQYGLKYIEYGWGTFFTIVDYDNYFLQVEKTCELWSGYNGIVKIFQKIEKYYTQVPKVTSYTPINTPEFPPQEDYSSIYGNYIYGLHPTQIDQSYFAPHMIYVYGPRCEPPITYVLNRPVQVVSHQVAINQTLNDFLVNAPINDIYFSCQGFYGEWTVVYYRAPEVNGIYCLFMKMDWTPYGVDPPFTEWIDYAFLWTEINYNGSNIISQLRKVAGR